MPFGYSNKIFKFPPVQYIPLSLNQNKIGIYPLSFDKTYFYIYNYQKIDLLHKKLISLGIPVNLNLKKEELGILVINGKIDLIQYRGHEVIMVGKKALNYYQIFKITDKYFYKDRLVFIFYNGKDNQKLAWKKYDK